MSRLQFGVEICPLWQSVIIKTVLIVAATAAEAQPSQQCLLQIDTNLRSQFIAAPATDTIELKVGNTSTGLKMPLMGFGTCCRSSDKGPALRASITAYLRHGGKLIDTAIMYQNHRDVGKALQWAFQGGQISREELWVTSKIAPNHASTEAEAMHMLDKALQDLGLDYVDLFLIHSPGRNSVAIWKGLIQAKAQGKAKAIGVSNFRPNHIKELELAGLERPSVNQIEFHPWVSKDVFENVAWCQSHNVAVTAYGSVGSSYHHGLQDPKVQEVAKKHGMTAAQVLLSWALQQNVAVVPGATSEEHIVENLQASSFDLDSEEMGLH